MDADVQRCPHADAAPEWTADPAGCTPKLQIMLHKSDPIVFGAALDLLQRHGNAGTLQQRLTFMQQVLGREQLSILAACFPDTYGALSEAAEQQQQQ